MTDDELDAVLRAHTSGRIGTHWETCHLDGNPRHHSGCAVGKLVAECRRLTACLQGANNNMEEMERSLYLQLQAAEDEQDRLRAEVAELREQMAGQKAINLRLAERLRACSEVLGRVAEKGGRVCECQTEH